MPDQQRTSAEGRLTAALEELAELLMATTTFHDLMQKIAELSVRTVGTALTCGITMANGGRVITVAAADPLGAQLDEQQYLIDEGPCLEALRTAKIVISADLAKEDRWDGYPQRAMAYGVSTVYSSPLIVRGQALGVLNLYGDTPDGFDGDECAAAIAQIVTLTGVAITGTLRNYGDVTLTDQLQEALSSRSVIDQAMGILMGAQHCTADQAFQILRSASQTRNVRLAQIAQDLLNRTTTPVDRNLR